MPSIQQWLVGLGLERYSELFALHSIDFDVLAELSDADLEKLQIPLGDRKRLLRAIAGLAAPADVAAALERRPVTVLFVDITDYTGLTGQLGAEFTHKLARRFHQLASQSIREHGGSVEKYVGDAVMGVFGIPSAHGDDPERALRTAAAIHAQMPQLSSEFGRPLTVHIGAATGLVVASRQDARTGNFSSVGDTVNLAARLVGLAAAGDTVISDTLFQAALGFISAEPVGDVQVKGFEKAVRVWRVIGLADRAVRTLRRRELPLVGRQAELRQFDAAGRACLAARTGQLVYLRGEAGIGKSRLVEALEAAAASLGFQAHRALVLNFGVARANDAISQVVASLLGCEPGADAQPRADALRRAAQSKRVDDDHLVFARDLLGIEQPPSEMAVYHAMDNSARARGRSDFVVALVRACATAGPLLVIIEDIHWADAVMLDIFAGIAMVTSTQPLILLLTSRFDGDPLDRGWRSRVGTAALLSMDLRPLQPAEAVEMARSLGAADELIARCVQRAEGNPLFLEQLLRAALMTDREAVPGSIQSLVLSRLDRLPARDQQAIRAASILGQRFALAPLRRLLGDADYDCSVLLNENLVRGMGDEAFLFAHALIWESTYQSLVSDDKRRWHTLAADWHAQDDPALAAEHLDRAGDPRAAQAYLTAAQGARRSYRSDRALALLDRGLELALDPPTRFELLVERGELLPDLGRAAEAAGFFDQALALAADDRQRCRVLIGIASGMRMSDQLDAAVAALDRAEPLASGPGRELDAAQIHYLRGSVVYPLGQVERTLHEHECTLRLARQAGSPEWEARALSGLSDAHYGQFRLFSAHRCFEQSIDISRAHGLGAVEVANLGIRSLFDVFFLLPMQQALARSEQTRELAIKVGRRRSEILAFLGSTIILNEMGEPARAQACAETGLELVRSIGARRFVPEIMLHLATSLAQQGRTAQAAELLREAIELSRQLHSYLAPSLMALLASVTDDAAVRQPVLAEAERMLERGTVAHDHFFFYRRAIEVSLRLGEWAHAEHYANLLQAKFSAEPVPMIDFIVERARAIAATGRGVRDAALAATLEQLARRARDAQILVWLPMIEEAAVLRA